MAETRKRYDYAPFAGRRTKATDPTTHDAAFREAFKRQKRAAEAAAELDAGSSEHLDAYRELFGDEAADRLAAQLLAAKYAAIAEAEEYASADAEVLSGEEIDVVEIETISGPRRVFADRVDEYVKAGLVEGSDG